MLIEHGTYVGALVGAGVAIVGGVVAAVRLYKRPPAAPAGGDFHLLEQTNKLPLWRKALMVAVLVPGVAVMATLLFLKHRVIILADTGKGVAVSEKVLIGSASYQDISLDGSDGNTFVVNASKHEAWVTYYQYMEASNPMSQLAQYGNNAQAVAPGTAGVFGEITNIGPDDEPPDSLRSSSDQESRLWLQWK